MMATSGILIVYAVAWGVALAGTFVWMALALRALLRKVGGTPAHAWIPILRWVAAARAARMAAWPVAVARSVALLGTLTAIAGALLEARALLVGGGVAALLGSLVGWVLWIYGSGTIEMRLRAPAALSWLAAVSPVIWASVMGWGKYGRVADGAVMTADAGRTDSTGAPAQDGDGAADTGLLPRGSRFALGSEDAAPLPTRPARGVRSTWGSSPSSPSAPGAPAGEPEQTDSREPEAAAPTWAAVVGTSPTAPPQPPVPQSSTPATGPLDTLPPGWAGAAPGARSHDEDHPTVPLPEEPPAPRASTPAQRVASPTPSPQSVPAPVEAAASKAAPTASASAASPPTPEPATHDAARSDGPSYRGPVSPYLQAPGSTAAASAAAPSPPAVTPEQEAPLPWAAQGPEPAVTSPPAPRAASADEPRTDTWEPWAAGAPLPAPPPLDDDDDRTVIARRRTEAWAIDVVGGARYPLPPAPVVLGRATARAAEGRLGIDDPTRTMSKVHAELTFEDGAWSVRDLRSTNGTYLRNGDQERPVGDHAPTAVEGVLLLGDLEVRIVLDEGGR